MFVVNLPSKTQQIAASRTATTASRGSGSFRLNLAAGTGRGSDTSVGRANSQHSVTTPPAVENMPVPPPPPPSAPAAPAGMKKLMDTLSSLGMSTSGLNISYTEELVGYPGGSYVNKMINVTSGGKTEQFSAELTEKNPLVTAYELQRYFGVTPNPASASGSVRHA